jgi:superfamily II DNA or RNA helicase
LPRSGAKTDRRSPPRLPAHPSLLNVDLKAWVGEGIAASGRREALLGRVEFLRLAPSGRLLEARVRGNRPTPYRARVWIEGERMVSRCTCARESRPACKHAVAALEALRFPLSTVPRQGPGRRGRSASGHPARDQAIDPGTAQSGYLLYGGAERTLTREERVDVAAETELTNRRQRARRDRETVTPIPPSGGPPRFEVDDRRLDRTHRVTLRGPKGRLASCSCEDFSANELASCSHVERVRMWTLRKKKQMPESLLSLWWQPRSWTEEVPDPLQEIRIERPDGDGFEKLDRYFDADGWLRPCPRDRKRAAWADEAIETARRSAIDRDWTWDLDALAAERLKDARREAATASTLATITPSTAAWQDIISRLGFRLHPYQETGALFLAREGRAMLADDMGLGKTVQAIVAALLLRRISGASKALVVCPASLKHQWRREIDKAYGEQAIVVEGSRTSRLATYRNWREGFLILNYELVLRDLEAIRDTRPDLVILDEAQRIKNWDTKTARAVKQLDSPHAFILTGTPLENRLLELHSLVEFLHPRALGPRWRLLPVHAVSDPMGRVIAYEGLEVLRRRLSGFFLRRERRAVLDQLPERTDNTFWTGMTLAQRRPYRRYASTVAALVSRNMALRPGDVRVLLQSLTSMRILCNAYAQFDWKAFERRVRHATMPTRAEIKNLGSPKLEEFERVMEDLLDDGGGKIVVFSQWERMLRLAHFVVRELLHERDLRADVFHGGLNSRARDDMLESFRLDPEFHVLFSTDAGGLGLNLQEAASIVVNLEVPWNPAVLEQRIGRVHRIGQARSVQVLHFVTGSAIEERVRQIVEGKRALFEGLLSEQVDRVVFDDTSRSSFVQRVRTLLDDHEDSKASLTEA